MDCPIVFCSGVMFQSPNELLLSTFRSKRPIAFQLQIEERSSSKAANANRNTQFAAEEDDCWPLMAQPTDRNMETCSERQTEASRILIQKWKVDDSWI